MEKRIEKWESLRLEAQKFTPQEYVAACESMKELIITPFNPGCDKGSLECDNKTTHPVHFDQGMQIKINPTGASDVSQFWEDVYDKIMSSREFTLYCDGVSEAKATGVRVLGRGSKNITEINPGNLEDEWGAGYCGFNPSDIGNPNCILVLQGASWDYIKNHS